MRTMLLATLLAVGIGAPAYAQKYTCSESRMIGDAIAELRDKGQTLAEFDASIDADSDTPEGKNETKSLAKAIYGFPLQLPEWVVRACGPELGEMWR
ncbi:MAG TPA: hypothetical protein VMB73_04180 [Acetobacteraceae bacterium]|jgi:hypothetical protein|nr:hypothetical protein [Acetobacteraceae bacterium]